MLGGLAWLLTRSKSAAAADATPPAGGTTPRATGYSAADVDKRIAALAARASQARAQSWVPHLERAGAPPSVAKGLARWIGIESAGDPKAQSRLNERGLLQIMPSTAKMVFTPQEMARMESPTTTNEEHARMAIKQFRWHVSRAKIPETASTTDQLWYAKVHHARPRDLMATKLRPDAATAAAFAAARATTPLQKLRLSSANMVAFGVPGLTS